MTHRVVIVHQDVGRRGRERRLGNCGPLCCGAESHNSLSTNDLAAKVAQKLLGSRFKLLSDNNLQVSWRDFF